MAAQIKLTLKHEEFPDLSGPSTVETVVDVQGGFPEGLEALIECVREEYEHGLKSAAGGHLVNYESFSGDSEYLDTIDRVIKEISVVDVTVVGAKDEEQFAAVWALLKADPSLVDPAPPRKVAKSAFDPIDRGETGPETFERYLDSMHEIDLDDLPQPAAARAVGSRRRRLLRSTRDVVNP